MTEPGSAGRAQDQGRRHRSTGSPSRATVTLLVVWQETLRTELRAVVDALNAAAEPGLLADVAHKPAIGLDDPRRDSLIERGIKVARELGTEVDPTPPPGTLPSPAPRSRRARPVDFG